MNQYEVTFIVDPVLSGGEIKSAAQTYVDAVKKAGADIVHTEETGLRQLAYSIKKRTSGIYYTIEFSTPNGEMISPLELSFRRDDRILRFLTVRLDKFGVKFNADRRAGLIGKKRDKDDKGSKKGKGAEAVKKAAAKPKAKAKPAPTTSSSEEE